MSYIKVTYPVGNSFIRSTFEDNSTYIKTSVNSTFIKVAYDGGSSGLDAERLRTKVYNVTGATLAKGTVVYINGSHGNLPSVAKAIATSDATSAQTFGLVLEDITDNKSGYIILAGKIGDLDTQAIANGSQLYLSSTIAGGYTTTKQYAPAHLVYIGVVNRSHPTQGEIEVKIQNGYEADEIHDFAVRNPSNNDGIFFNTTTSLWEKKSIGTVLGYTPANAATTLTINGVTFDISSNRSWTIAAGISGSGTSGQVSYWTGASSLGGSNNFFWDAANNRLGIGTNTPSHNLSVKSSTSVSIIHNQNNGVGGQYFISNGPESSYMTGGALFNGSSWVAQSTSAVLFGAFSGDVRIYADKSLTSGNTYTPTERFTIFGSTGNFGINTSTDDTINKLQVSGSAKFTSDIVVNGINIGLGAGNVASNLRFGGSALLSNTTGAGNVALGYAAMYYNLNGSNNMAIGVQALVGNSSGDNNVAVGTAALFGNSNGYNNVAIGHWAAYDSVGSLSNSVGANNIFIGYGCLGESAIESNRTWIGNAQTTSTWLGGNLLLGKRTNSTERLQVVGNVNFGNSTGFTWDDTNKRLGIGTNAPQDQVHIANTAANVNTILRLSVNPNHANIISFRNADGTAQGGFLATGSTFSYGTYVSNQCNLTGGSGGIGLRIANTAESSLVVYGGNTNADFSTKYLQVFGNTGNVLIQNAGVYSDSGERLQVTGNTKITGAASTSASNGLSVLNSSAVAIFNVRNDGRVSNGDSTFYVDRYAVGGTTLTVSNAGHNGATGIRTTSAIGLIAVSNLGVSTNNSYGASVYAAGGNVNAPTNISLGLLSNRALISASNGLGMHVSSMLQVDSTTQGFLPPRMTTTQKNAIATPAAGLVVFDTTLNKLCVYTTTWETITSV